MSRRCQASRRLPGFGKAVSHSHHRTNRRWNPNVQTRRFFVPSLGRTVRLTVSTKALRTIDRRGIDAVVADLLARGEKV